VHLWCASLDLPDLAQQSLAALLSAEERDRARTFRFERDRQRWIARRGLLRRLLGRYLGVDPAELRFVYGPRGKPALAAPAALAFNLSHSGGLALYGISAASSIRLGVDVELIRSDLAHLPLAKRYFSPAEQSALQVLPRSQQLAAFFRCWTRKEAFVKALGEGLSVPLDSFDVSLSAGEAQLLAWRHPAAAETVCTLFDLEPAPGFAAALAVIGAVVGEFVGADRGLGFLINRARGQYDTALVFVAILALVLMALCLYGTVAFLEMRLLSWRERLE
jgi:4'-phosphopantetheinyl transferase